MKVAVIMNAGAGSIGEDNQRERAEAIRAAFAAAGVEVELHACPGAQLTDTARTAANSGVDAVVAAGGDGTVSAVATALAGGDVPMAVLPLGTLNHFARDLGMPDDLTEAARAIATQTRERVDVGEVNGRVFVNNASIGLYPELVLSRDAEQKATGHSKYRAMMTAGWRLLRRFPLLLVHLEAGDVALRLRTPFVFVGNNPYQLSPRALGQRPHLDRGTLSVYVPRCEGRAKLFWLLTRAILQRLEAVDDFEARDVTAVEVVLHHRHHVKVAIDGEVVTMASPLRFRIRPGALVVLRGPAAEAIVAPAAEVAA